MWEYHDPYSPAPDELYHFKYIKRYKGSSGKWQYVYADKNTHNRINNGFIFGERNRIRGSMDVHNTSKYNLDHTINRDGSRLTAAQRRGMRKAALRTAERSKSEVQGAYNLVDAYDIRNQARRAVGGVRNTLNNAARKGADARKRIGNKASALKYRLKNRGLAGRQADRDAIDSMITRERRGNVKSRRDRGIVPGFLGTPRKRKR